MSAAKGEGSYVRNARSFRQLIVRAAQFTARSAAGGCSPTRTLGTHGLTSWGRPGGQSVFKNVAIAAAMLLALTPVGAAAQDFADRYWQCVPFARLVSGVQIHGNAGTWWSQAEGRYERGNIPQAGAVLVFKPNGRMRVGHVAMVSEVIDSRTIRLTHANWSPINGSRGQVETGVEAIDVSEANDWSEVRVWYAPLQDLGTSAHPTFGFIYQDEQARQLAQLPSAEPAPRVVLAAADLRDDPIGDLIDTGGVSD